jgi:hypothetical protein
MDLLLLLLPPSSWLTSQCGFFLPSTSARLAADAAAETDKKPDKTK